MTFIVLHATFLFFAKQLSAFKFVWKSRKRRDLVSVRGQKASVRTD